MKTFYYQEHRKMDKQKGRKYATTYIKQSAEHYKRLKDEVKKVYDKFVHNQHIDDIRAWCDTPIGSKHKRKEGTKKGTAYTRWDCIRDAHEHLWDKGHDMTVSIANRWNKVFEDYPQMQWQWDLESNYQINQFNRIAEIKD